MTAPRPTARRLAPIILALTISLFPLGFAGAAETLAAAPIWRTENGAIALSYAPPAAAERNPALGLALLERFSADAAAAQAQAEIDRKEKAGRGDFHPHLFARREAAWEMAAPDTEHALVSVLCETFVDAGGAHPMTRLKALLWDAKAARPIDWPVLFGAETPPGPIRAAWRKAAAALRRARGLEPDEAALDAAEARLAATPVTLAPSTVPGKAGGLVFQHEPYEIGPYAAGPMRVVLPLTEIADLLSPEYAPYFAGAPDRAAITAER